jgi:sn-1 stearoyl-lipid 9-desaturase
VSSSTLPAVQASRINWVRSTVIIGVHLAAISAFFIRPTLKDLILGLVFYILTGLGVTMGFHRLLAHRSFQCPTWFKRFLVIFGTASLQGGPIWWVGVHRRHHQACDTANDPHSPVRGFLFSHFGWMLRGGTNSERINARDLFSDRVIGWLDRGINPLVPWAVTGVICFAIGGWSAVVWGTLVRTVLLWHATWAVNSVCHVSGARPHDTNEKSGNVWWVALTTFGEGWHNNHHAHPQAAIHNERWWEFDPSAILLKIFERFGLVWDARRSRA